jgi:O-antigen/teichoic acid export membrane protein
VTDLARRRLPTSHVGRGLGTTTSGLLLAACFTYAFLALAARLLGPRQFAPLSALWAMVFIVGPGLFLPLQQELGRLLAGHRERRTGGLIVRQTAVVAGVMAASGAAAILVAGPWLTRRLLDGHWFLLGCLATSVVTWAVAYVVRGAFTGYGDFRGFAQLIAGEAMSRLPIAGLLILVGLREIDAFGAALALAPLVSALLVTRRGRRLRAEPGERVPWRSLTRAMGWLVAGSFLAQFLANAGPLTVQLLASDGQQKKAGIFLSALVIARLTFYLFQAAQAAILPNLAELVAQGRASDLRSSLRRLIRLCGALVLLTTGGAFVLGPLAVRVLFGSDYLIGARTIALLAGASSVYVLAAALNSVAIAAHGHRLGALAWLAGGVGFCAGLATSDELFLRVEVGYLLGTCVAAAILLRGLPPLVDGLVPGLRGQNGEVE